MEKPKILIRLTVQLRGQGDKTPAVREQKTEHRNIVEEGILHLTISTTQKRIEPH